VLHSEDMLEARPVNPSLYGDEAQHLLLSAAEYARYRSELDELRRSRDRDLPQLLRDARTYVVNDAIEEIAQIEDDDAIVRARIGWLQDLLDDATVVADGEAAHVATLGRAVEVEYMRTGKRRRFVLAGSAASGGPRTVSARSPVGQAVMGRATGDVVTAELPGGRIEELRLLSVRPGLPDASTA
jgi:transcription elongation factor GreA